MSLVVERAGPSSLLQDDGRPGLGHLGVSVSGAFDRGAYAQVNRLLGNGPRAAVIEAVGGGLALRIDTEAVVAVTGGNTAISIDGEAAPFGRALWLRAGQLLLLGPPVTGLRAYIGIAGGFAGPAELGSRSTDTLAALGPAPLTVGDHLVAGSPSPVPDLDDVLALGRPGDLDLGVVMGPRDEWFTADAVRLFLQTPWRIGSESNRIGVRLEGPALDRSRSEELPSEPCTRGSIQVTSAGQPIVLGPDHPVTGGYPVIGVVADADTDRLAQARPGQVVRLHPVSLP